MIKVFQAFYIKYIRNRFFNKIMLFYTLIIIFTLAISMFVTLHNFKSLLWNKAVDSNKQVLLSVYNYYNSKQTLVKKSIQNTRMYANIKSNIYYILNNNINSADYNDIERIRLLENFLSTTISSDSDISDVAIIKKSDNTTYLSSRTRNSIYNENLSESLNLDRIYRDNKYGTTVLPTITNIGSDNVEKRKYSFVSVIWNEDFSAALGTLVIRLDTDSIKKSYSIYKDDLDGYIIILTSDGNVIFDSSGKYYNKKYPYMNVLKPSGSSAVLEEDSVINYCGMDDNSGLIFLGVIPKSQIYKEINATSRTIYIVSFILIFITLLLIYASTSVFSRRVKVLNDSIKKVQEGNLSAKINIKSGDEIGQISDNFNHMCSKLEVYINKVYISELTQKDLELRQKNAELYALQSQVDPHFLYNALEVIRMKAVTTGKDDVGKMIQILASLFRNNIKPEMIVQIKDELEYCESYLEFYSYRFEDRLEITFDIEAEIMEYGIIKHTLQPLIENSIVHGIDFSSCNNQIEVRGYKADNDIYIVIEDNGKGISETELETIKAGLENTDRQSKNNIGIQNVNQRIKLMYGNNYGISICSKDGKGTAVTVKLKAKTKRELENNVHSAVG